LTRDQGLGKRLKDHLTDNLGGKWDRFSWFGFKEIGPANGDGILSLVKLDDDISENTRTTIGDLEALLIRAIGPKRNTAWMNFKDASEWTQVGYDETEKFVGRLIDKTLPQLGG
jgi:hypothetical protein